MRLERARQDAWEEERRTRWVEAETFVWEGERNTVATRRHRWDEDRMCDKDGNALRGLRGRTGGHGNMYVVLRESKRVACRPLRQIERNGNGNITRPIGRAWFIR